MMAGMTTFDERARDWDIPERRERAKALAGSSATTCR